MGLADGGTTDDGGLAAAIRGLQNKYPEPDGEYLKVVAFAYDFKKKLPIYFQEVPDATPQDISPEPKPWLFDKWLRKDTREIDENLSIITFYARTITNPAWGIRGGYFYEIVAVDVGPDL